jgi:sulfoxide reductase heme-binding subunit YedZ
MLLTAAPAYILCIIVALSLFLISALIANLIQFQPDTTSDHKTRKTWFWVLAFLTPSICYGLGYFMKPVTYPLALKEYMTALAIGTGVAFVVYVILGVVVSKILPRSKPGSWFN